MDPNDKFRHIQGNKVISVANLPDHFKIRDPEEYRMEMQEILEEMGFCHKCGDHLPCGCDLPENKGRVIGLKVKHGCINCGGPATGVGGFCSTRCQKEYIGEV